MEKITSTIYEIVPRNPESRAVGNPKVASQMAIKSLRNSGFYDYIATSNGVIFHNGEGYNVRFDSGDHNLKIDDFMGDGIAIRGRVERLLSFTSNLRLEELRE